MNKFLESVNPNCELLTVDCRLCNDSMVQWISETILRG
jgi:hypothetical protein